MPIIHFPGLIASLMQRTASLSGDVAEVGVYQGASADLICGLAGASRVHLFDTFRGIPALTVAGLDGCLAGEFGDTSVQRVERTLSKHANYKIYQGLFSEQCRHVRVPLRFVHCDVDLYESTRQVVEWAWPLLVPCGILLCDDYGAGKCRGAKKAMDDHANQYGVVLHCESGRAYVIKPEAST